jgi:hypothetical protein
MAGGFEGNAGGVAAVAAVRVARARCRAPDAEEADVQQCRAPVSPVVAGRLLVAVVALYFM